VGNIMSVPLLKEAGVELHEEPAQAIHDPRFPTVKSPNPENAEALSLAVKLAEEKGLDLVMATDPDCDRMGCAVREAGEVYGEHIGTSSWTDWQSNFDALNSHGARNYWKSHTIDKLSDPCIDAIIEHTHRYPTPNCEVLLCHMEGAPAKLKANATAYAHRKARFIMNVHTRWADSSDDTKCLNWARDIWEATKPCASGVYVNFISDEGADRVRDAYPKDVWERLVKIKDKYDPENFFRMNQNIRPR
jgi:hypothetical protein